MAPIIKVADSKYTLAIAILWLIWLFGSAIETKFFPVASSFTITKSSMSGEWVETPAKTFTYVNRMTIYGNINITRKCDQFIGASANYKTESGVEKTLDFKFDDNKRSDTKSRKPGFSEFGPWYIDLPNDSIDKFDLDAYHICHPFWITKTDLATISVVDWVKP